MMDSSRTAGLLLISMIACAGGLSCKPSESQAIADRESPQKDKRVLSKQEMVAIATKAGPRYGRDPNTWEPFIDERNVTWRDFALRRHYRPHFEDLHMVWPVVKDDELDAAIAEDFPMLKGHDYQTLWYAYRLPGPFYDLDTETCILIDRNTGETLAVVGAFGQVLRAR